MSDDELVLDFDAEKYLALKATAKVYTKDRKYQKALLKYQEMFEMRPSERLEKTIAKLQTHLIEEESSEEDGDMIDLENGFSISRIMYDKLYPYQKDGLDWMWNLHKKKKGGILADDMGMGKTVQIIAFLSGLVDTGKIKTILIVMPVSLITNWEDEFNKWCPGMRVLTFHGASVREKERNLLKTQRRGGVLLTSYGILVTSSQTLASMDGRSFKWDYLILDEGHKIKNPTKTTKAAHEIPANHRLVLTGTPVQNNLRELWALYDFCHQGSLLGSLQTFKAQYENPITTAREKDATSGEKKYGGRIAENLRKLIEPYFLRRTKAEHIAFKENVDPSSKKASLPRKNEFILWVFLSDKQIEIYKRFLESDDVKIILNSKKSPLVQLNVLKKICDHPRLFTRRACAELDMETSFNQSIEDPSADAASIEVDPNLLLKESGKMEALILLLENLKENGHRTLVFSLSRKILDIIEKILKLRHWRVARLDGTITKMSERQERIKKFQESDRYPVMLLTTQVGGVGLTITAADRVVIYDPSWNPATDAQAVDRAYRIGQTKPVVVYRFITCGTIEEKIYRRQIFKDSITRQVSSKAQQDKDPHRYFTSSELRELFILDDPKQSKTQRQVAKLHAHNRKTTPELDEHIAFLLSLQRHVYNISDHDLMFRGEIPEEKDQLAERPGGATAKEYLDDNYIQQRVEAAQEQIARESKIVEEQFKNTGSYKTTYCVVAKKFGEPSATATSNISKARSPLGWKNKGQHDSERDRFGDKYEDNYSRKPVPNFDIVSHLDQQFKDFGIKEETKEIIRKPPSKIAQNSMPEEDVIEIADSPPKGYLEKIRKSIERKPLKESSPMMEINLTAATMQPLLPSEYIEELNYNEILADESLELKADLETESNDSLIEESFKDLNETPLKSRNDFALGSARRKSLCTLPLRLEESSDESNDEDEDKVPYVQDSNDEDEDEN